MPPNKKFTSGKLDGLTKLISASLVLLLLAGCSFSPFSKQISFKDIPDKAYNEITKYNPIQPIQNPINYEIDPNLSLEYSALVKENGDTFLKHFQPYLGKTKIWIVAFNNPKWAKNILLNYYQSPTSDQLSQANNLFSNAGFFGACKSDSINGGAAGLNLESSFNYNSIVLFVSFRCQTGPIATLDNPSIGEVIGHELTHSLQGRFANLAEDQFCVPNWYLEGQASFIGGSFSMLNGKSTYSEFSKNQSKDYGGSGDLSRSEIVPNVLKDQVYNYDAYGDGFYAVQYLVAKYGWKKMLALSNLIEKPSCGANAMSVFRDAFKKNYGFELSKFYADVKPYLLTQINSASSSSNTNNQSTADSNDSSLNRETLQSVKDSCGNQYPDLVIKINYQVPSAWKLFEDNGCGSGSSYTWKNPNVASEFVQISFSASAGMCQEVTPNDIQGVAAFLPDGVKSMDRTDGSYTYSYSRLDAGNGADLKGALVMGRGDVWCTDGQEYLEWTKQISEASFLKNILATFLAGN